MVDVFFSADVETDGAIPGPYSMLSFALVYAGTYDGNTFSRPHEYVRTFYRELKPISEDFDPEALAINGLDRVQLTLDGASPDHAMDDAFDWIQQFSGAGKPVLVAYPLSFDWTWLYWYFIRYSKRGSPFGHSRCFDLKTAVAIKTGRTISSSSRAKLPVRFASDRPHTHHAVDDAIEQAEIFANIFEGGSE
ncbi:3'-5' exonuclease [Rhizobium leguminosarum]|uniref:3'-5' exonuclease n=1 Tax=Rhizobium leguminosarum TaxID=384 RepID=UPI00102F72CC|nr:3'-5' exoribonuclease [Rhizobium leguminosarum]TAX90250.1 exonuclease [Rhizobium leguminosarum]